MHKSIGSIIFSGTKILMSFLAALLISGTAFSQNKGAAISVYHLQKLDDAISVKAYYKYKTSLIKKSNKSALSQMRSQSSDLFSKLLDAVKSGELSKKYDFSLPFDKNIFKKYPVSFSGDLKTVYFTLELKPLNIDKRILCILSAKLVSNTWKNIEVLSFCSNSFSCKDPFIDADNKTMFFSSNKAGGMGGFDIYVSNKMSGSWSEPVNLGSAINKDSNEEYPFMTNKNVLYFSSDRRGGIGGYDIYRATKSNKWHNSVNMQKPVNSALDDIGVIVSDNQNEIYTIINKANIYKLFAFESAEPKVDEENAVTVPNAEYCAKLNARESVDPSAKNIVFEWVFDDGSKLKGYEVEKCFQAPGKHMATLNVINKSTGEIKKNEKQVPLMLKDEDGVPVYISGIANKDSSVVFDATGFTVPQSSVKSYKWDFGDLDKSNVKIPGPSKSEYYWDFGDGQGFEQGKIVEHTFTKKGTYTVRLIIWGNNPATVAEKNLYFKKQVVIK